MYQKQLPAAQRVTGCAERTAGVAVTQRRETHARSPSSASRLPTCLAASVFLGAKKRDLYQFHQRRCNKRCSGVVQFITCHVSATTHAGRLRRGVGTRMPRAGRVEQYAHAWDQGAAYLEVLATLNRLAVKVANAPAQINCSSSRSLSTTRLHRSAMLRNGRS